MFRYNCTLVGKAYMQCVNMKEISDVQTVEVSFDSTNSLYSVILSTFWHLKSKTECWKEEQVNCVH